MKNLVFAFCFMFIAHLAVAYVRYNEKDNSDTQFTNGLSSEKGGSTSNRRRSRTVKSADSEGEVDTRIIEGTLARPSQFPYQALVSYDDEPYCGASIIHPNWALTARHCILENETNTASVTVGTNRLDRYGGLILPVDFFIPHPAYKYRPADQNEGVEYVVHDIGLIHFKSPLEFSNKIGPLQVAPPELPNLAGRIGTIAGWGATRREGRSALLQTAQVRVLPQATCRKYWPYVTVYHLCTSVADRKSVCLGDSGGALLVNGRQYGVISTAEEDCGLPKPNLYADVSAYTPWIEAEVRRYGDTVLE